MNAIELQQNLNQFSGSETFTKLYPRLTITEGALYLAENAQCWWLMDMIYSHIPKLAKEGFGVAKLTVVESTAVFTIDDGNDHILATQKIDYTDFPLPEIKLYIADNGDAWTILLPQEY